jgi:hypothetical protein
LHFENRIDFVNGGGGDRIPLWEEIEDIDRKNIPSHLPAPTPAKSGWGAKDLQVLNGGTLNSPLQKGPAILFLVENAVGHDLSPGGGNSDSEHHPE